MRQCEELGKITIVWCTMYKVHLRGAIKYSAIYLAVNNKSSCFCRYGTISIVLPYGYWMLTYWHMLQKFSPWKYVSDVNKVWTTLYFSNLFVQSSHVQIIDWYIRHDLSISHDRNSGSITSVYAVYRLMWEWLVLDVFFPNNFLARARGQSILSAADQKAGLELGNGHCFTACDAAAWNFCWLTKWTLL